MSIICIFNGETRQIIRHFNRVDIGVVGIVVVVVVKKQSILLISI